MTLPLAETLIGQYNLILSYLILYEDYGINPGILEYTDILPNPVEWCFHC